MAQVVVASCATCATAQTPLFLDTHSYLLDFFALVMQIVPLTGKTKLVAQVVVASCATCATTKYCAQLWHKWHNHLQLLVHFELVAQVVGASATVLGF